MKMLERITMLEVRQEVRVALFLPGTVLALGTNPGVHGSRVGKKAKLSRARPA